MPAPYTEALKEAYACAPADEMVLDTIEIHAVAPDGSHIFTTPIRLVLDDADWLLTLEQTAPVNPGQAVTFNAFRFGLTLPQCDATGLPELRLSIANVSEDIEEALLSAVEARAKILVIYRAYTENRTNGPQSTPITLIGTNPTADDGSQTVEMRCSAADWANTAVPREVYARARFPGLAR